jgi:hypothetical protein
MIKSFSLAYGLIWAFILSGCSPLLNPKTTHQLSHVCIESMDGRMGQVLRHRLKNTIHPTTPLYTLTIALGEQTRSLVLNRQGQSAINHYILKAEYTLCRRQDECILGKGKIRVYGVKPMTVSYYSQTVMDQATQARACESLAEKIIHAIAMDLNRAPACGCPVLKPVPHHESYSTPTPLSDIRAGRE